MSDLKELVLTYFRGVDGQNIELICETLSEDCAFSVETHGVKLTGHDEIRGMFEKLWSDHAAVRHDRFHFVDAENGADVAVRFRVTNTLHDGSLVFKSNCNFFTATDGRFTEVRVYMAGENTLERNR